MAKNKAKTVNDQIIDESIDNFNKQEAEMEGVQQLAKLSNDIMIKLEKKEVKKVEGEWKKVFSMSEVERYEANRSLVGFNPSTMEVLLKK